MKKLIPVIIFFLLVFVAGLLQHDDPDMYIHLAMGNVIAHQGIIHHEVLSQAGPSRPYIPYEWLFQLLFYWFVAAFGFNSYHVFTAIFAVAQTAALYLLLRKGFRTNTLSSLILSACYVIFNFSYLVPRPQIIANTLLILSLFLIFKYLLQNKNYLYLLLPIGYIWGNIHPSVIMSILLCLGYSGMCFLGVFTKNRKVWLKKSGILALYGLGIFISTILPPQGFNAYKDLWLIYKYGYLNAIVNQEWAPLFKNNILFISYSAIVSLTFLAFVIVLIKKKLFIKSVWLYPLIVFIPYGYISIRNTYFGYLTAIILTGWILAHFTSHQITKKKTSFIVIFIAVLLICELCVTYVHYISTRLNYPVKATEFIQKENIQGKMFNQFGYGGYLEYHLYPSQKVFMDGRVETFFCCEMQDYYNLQVNAPKLFSQYQTTFDNIFDKNQFSYAVLVTKDDPSGEFLANVFTKKPKWILAFKDDVSQIWVKKDKKNIKLLNKLVSNQLIQSNSKNTNKFTMHLYQGMHIVFTYPENINYKQINSQLVALSDPSKKGDDNTLYIYSAVVPANTDNFKIPFTIPGPMTHSSMIKIHGFIANQETYGNGANEVNLLVLRKGNQTIVLRIPPNSKSLAQTITQIVNSIQTLE
ncbi:MAG TPA: hypothetical protein VND99_00420 [Candidatus Acidoferrales bacterium]|nr:hypothetical protein [Candidatus Acidoferrales bacterium]